MVKLITLSERSRKLIKQSSQLIGGAELHAFNMSIEEGLERSAVVAWLSKNESYDKKSRFLEESLRTALLEDLHDSLLNESERHKKRNKNTIGWLKKAQYIFLAVAGMFLAICEGFDGMATFLGSFSMIPTAFVFTAGIVFSMLSLGLFYSFGLIEISKNVGVSFRKSSQLLDVFLEQVEHINKIKNVINDLYTDVTPIANERKELKKMVTMLVTRYDSLDIARTSYMAALDAPLLKTAKLVTGGMTALLFFGGGFSTGQTLAYVVAGLFMASVSATFWPIVVAGAVAGLSALSLYLLLHRPVFENLVSHWVGLDKESVEAFADDEVVSEQKLALQQLQKRGTQIEYLQNEAIRLPMNKRGKKAASSAGPSDGAAVAIGEQGKHFTFFNRLRSQSLGDLEESCSGPLVLNA